jgi:hypothetical protein
MSMGYQRTFKKYNSLGEEVDVHPTKTMARQIKANIEKAKGSSFPKCRSILIMLSQDIQERSSMCR